MAEFVVRLTFTFGRQAVRKNLGRINRAASTLSYTQLMRLSSCTIGGCMG